MKEVIKKLVYALEDKSTTDLISGNPLQSGQVPIQSF